MTILDEIIQYKASKDSIRERFVEFIKNKSIPLNDRWNTFLEAPHEWKNHETWVQHFDIEKKLPNKEIYWYDDLYIERYQTVVMSDMVSDIMEDLIDSGSRGLRISEMKWTIELLEELKEEILSKNLGSFIYDW